MNQPEKHIKRTSASGVRGLLAVSQITRRILAVNALALIVLAGGLLYLGEYRENLIDAEMEALKTNAELFAVALGEGAVQSGGEDERIRPEVVGPMVRRLVKTTGTRARLFAADGVVLADSNLTIRPGGRVLSEPLPPPGTGPGTSDEAIEHMMALYHQVMRGLSGPKKHQIAPDSHAELGGEALPEVAHALKGESVGFVREPKGHLELSVAVPVQRYKHVLGALLLTRDGTDVEQAIFEVRLNTLGIFAMVLVATMMVSFYLAGTIARPIHILAEAAEKVRHGHGRLKVIPDFKGRTDEVGDLARSLRDMTQALWQRMDAIERFAADVAHEIKNPLTSLQSAVETAARVSDPAMQKKLMVVIADDVRRLDRLITDISNASRLDAELSKTETEIVELTAMLETLADIDHATGASGATISLKVVRGLRVEGIGDHLVQVFRNLIANARSFSPSGGTITITAGASDDKTVTVTIEDEGPGIQPGKEDAIFERFYTERPKTEAFGTHSGLGLSISRQIIETLDGTLRAENRTDDTNKIIGARFIVELPKV